jgi:isopentenyl phosphate kinase
MILEYLCSSLRPTAAVFLTDVPGVFTKPPAEEGAKLIPEITVDYEGRAHLPMMSSADHDVTGGIEVKLKTAISIVAQFGIPVFIVEVGTRHAADAINGRVPEIATAIRRL